MGREFRPQMYINIFNRLRSLEFEECKLIRKVMPSVDVNSNLFTDSHSDSISMKSGSKASISTGD